MRRSLKIVYYDLYCSTHTIASFVNELMQHEKVYVDEVDSHTFDIFVKNKSLIKFSVNEGWDRELENMSVVINSANITYIYQLYVDLCNIKRIVDKEPSELTLEAVNEVYNLMLRDICYIHINPEAGGIITEIDQRVISTLAELQIIEMKLKSE